MVQIREWQRKLRVCNKNIHERGMKYAKQIGE